MLQKERERLKGKDMALQQFTRDMAPNAVRSSTPKVTIGEQGQLVLSKALADKLGDVKAVRLAFDKESHKIVLAFATAVPEGKENEYFNARRSDKTKQVMVSAGGFLTFCGYDYKKAGNQPYEKINLNKLQVSFTLPTETPARRPSKPRPRKAKAPAEVAQAATAGTAPAAPVNAGEEDLADLEGAE